MSSLTRGAARALSFIVVAGLLAAAPAPAPGHAASRSASTGKPQPHAKDPAVMLAQAAPGVRARPDHYVVTAADGANVEEILADYRHRMGSPRRFRSVLAGFSVKMNPGTAKAVAQDERVALVEPDWLLDLATTQSNPTWGLDRIDQTHRPLTATYTYNSAGRGVRIYVVDTGVHGGHREFGRRVVRGYDATGRGSTRDCHGHGTHVAGTIAGRRYGVAKAATIVPVRAGCGMFRTTDVLASLNFVVRHHRAGQPAVMNMSLGGWGSRTLDTAVRRVIADGVTVVAAAGNEGANACYFSPGRVAGAITVGASDRRDRIASFSNGGSCLDVFAPGVAIRSASSRSRTRSVVRDGTSMAAPHVAGVAARILGRRPKASPDAIGRTIRSSAVRGRLRNRIYGDPDRLLQLPGRAAVRLHQAAPVSAVAGQPFAVTGTIRDAVSGRPVAGRTVHAYHRPLGAASWTRVGSGVTGATGQAVVRIKLAAAGDVQLRHPGAPDSRRAVAAASRVTVTAAPTRLDFDPWETYLWPGESTWLEGELYRPNSYAPIAGQVVTAYARTIGASTWQVVGSAATDAYGAVEIKFTPATTVDVQLRFGGTPTLQPATSGVSTITVEECDYYYDDWC